VFNGYVYLPSEGSPWFFVKHPAGLAGEQVAYIRKPEQIPGILAGAGLPLPGKLLLETGELSYNDCMRLLAVFCPRAMGDATALMRSLRMIKTPWEIGQFRLSARQHERTYAAIPALYRRGMTDLELQYEIEYLMRRNGSTGLFRTFGPHMDIFQGSLLAGANAETPSPFDFALGGGGMAAFAPVGANGTRLEEGMSVMIDMAGNYTAYLTDMTRTFCVGRLCAEARRAHRVALDIQRETERLARPGTSCAGLYELAARMAAEAGLSDCFMGTRRQVGFVGHGIGLQINERPVLEPRSADCLEAGMVFALEPKFVIPGTGAVGIENSFLVTETGLEKLTSAEEDIIELV
jgi:Xaa-Pro aminopeptidase